LSEGEPRFGKERKGKKRFRRSGEREIFNLSEKKRGFAKENKKRPWQPKVCQEEEEGYRRTKRLNRLKEGKKNYIFTGKGASHSFGK